MVLAAPRILIFMFSFAQCPLNLHVWIEALALYAPKQIVVKPIQLLLLLAIVKLELSSALVKIGGYEFTSK